ncbi:hypothetical protein, partial [Hyphomonas sp. UBA3601]|uniref:hypothetical protein n=1 Tax=Hyphomonas sp. UBA3601 TaxID=1946626 RepID=UPI0025C0601A
VLHLSQFPTLNRQERRLAKIEQEITPSFGGDDSIRNKDVSEVLFHIFVFGLEMQFVSTR